MLFDNPEGQLVGQVGRAGGQGSGVRGQRSGDRRQADFVLTLYWLHWAMGGGGGGVARLITRFIPIKVYTLLISSNQYRVLLYIYIYLCNLYKPNHHTALPKNI